MHAGKVLTGAGLSVPGWWKLEDAAGSRTGEKTTEFKSLIPAALRRRTQTQNGLFTIVKKWSFRVRYNL